MPKTQKEFLIQEAQMQTKALQRIGVWRRLALSLMVIGILVAYTGWIQDLNILRGVLGTAMTVVFGGTALLIRTGEKNGKRNVERILKAAGEN